MDTAERLRALDAETWGERVARARNRSGMSLKEAAARVSELVPVSYSSLMRLESMNEPPADQRRRLVAFLTLVAYGYDPEQFGFDRDDLPRWVTSELLDDLAARPKSA